VRLRALALALAVGTTPFDCPSGRPEHRRGAQGGPVRGLTGAARLARVYDTIFDARFEQVAAELANACPPSPKEVCIVLQVVSLWWQIQLDPNNRALDGQFEQRVNAAIAIAEAWVKREPQRAEAWFYLGGAYGARVQWRVLRGERVTAARDGKRIKDALEQALELDPDMHDAWFGIGLYHYYADVAPAAARVLRWLLFLPGGDRVKGLQEMLRARDRGALLRSEADYQLHVLYLWYEQKPEEALELLEALRLRHEQNPHFLQLIAEVQDVYQHDLTASLRTWRALYTAARQQKVSLREMAEARARLGMALQLDRLFETDVAIEHLRTLVAEQPAAPWGIVAQAHLQLGQALDRMGQRADAIEAYRAALAATETDDPLEVRDLAREGLRNAPDTAATTAYRLSMEGWRALERGDLVAAEAALGESIALRPRDPVTRYRQARLLQAQKEDSAALKVLEAIVASRAVTPPTIYAFACVDAARLAEQRGDRARAIELYRLARDVFGADQRTKDTAARALTRLAAPSSRVDR
jgi:tetratricopeptide (TPR) repeat protein